MSTSNSPVSVLTLAVELVASDIEYLVPQPDEPVVRVFVDGSDPFGALDDSTGWTGFGPDDLLGSASPLLPLEHPRRVAIYRCSCGFADCGVIAPIITQSSDRAVVAWTDFRDYTGVVESPLSENPEGEGTLWGLPDLRFDARQYVAEVRRAGQDRSWESPQRRTARLVYELLKPKHLTLPSGLFLSSAAEDPASAGVILRFDPRQVSRTSPYRVERLLLIADSAEPDRAAADIAAQLTSTEPSQWTHKFAWNPDSPNC